MRTSTTNQSPISPKVEIAMRALDAAGLQYQRPTEHQLKCGSVNFYPARGTITVDGSTAIAERGLDAFLRLANAARVGADPRSLVTPQSHTAATPAPASARSSSPAIITISMDDDA